MRADPHPQPLTEGQQRILDAIPTREHVEAFRGAAAAVRKFGTTMDDAARSLASFGQAARKVRDEDNGIDEAVLAALRLRGLSPADVNRFGDVVDEVLHSRGLNVATLRQSLGEVLPGAVPLVSAAYGMPPKAFLDWVCAEPVGPREFVTRLLAALRCPR